MKNRYLLCVSTEDDINHYTFDTHKKAAQEMMDSLERALPEEMTSDYIQGFLGDEDGLEDALRKMGEEEQEEVNRLYEIFHGKEKMDYSSDELFISEDMVLFRDGDTVFNAEIIDLAKILGGGAA